MSYQVAQTQQSGKGGSLISDFGWQGGYEVVLVWIAQNNAQLHNLHVEQDEYEQCLVLLVIMHNFDIHNSHLMHNIVLLCTCE